MKTGTFAAAIYVSWIASVALPVDAKTLAWKLKTGDLCRVTVERTIRQKATNSEWTESIACELEWAVTDVDEEGQMTLKQTLSGVKHSILFPDDIMISYDSSAEGEVKGHAVALAKYWMTSLNVPRQVRLQSDGQLTPVPVEALAPPTEPAGPTATPPPPVTDWLQIPRAFGDTASSLPARDLEIDDQWSHSTALPWRDVADVLRLTTTYQYVGETVVNDVALDKIEIVMQWDDTAPTDAAQPVIIDRQAGGGTIYFDAAAGYLVESDRTQDLVVQLSQTDGSTPTVELVTSLKMRVQPIRDEPPSERVEP